MTSTLVEPGAASTVGPHQGRALGVVRRAGSTRLAAVLVPVTALVAALAVGGVLIALEGAQPLAVYGEVVRGVFIAPRGMSDTATSATPLVLIGLGYALAYRARVFTIGAEGQYLVGAVAAVGVVTASGVRDLPGPVLVVLAVVIGAAAGGAWAGITAAAWARFGASIVISSLMLVYVAQALLQWAIRVGIRDPDSFIPASRTVEDAALPLVPGLDTHLGFLIAVGLVPVLTWVLGRQRLGYRIDALGHNREALDANEVRSSRIVVLVVVAAGALAGLAGYVEVGGVTGRVGDAFSTGLGFTAIIVALLGRLHPVGVLLAGLALAGLGIGFEVAARSHELPSSLVGVILALVVVFVVVGDAAVERVRGPV